MSFGYRDDYPPYEFKEGPPSHLDVRPLVDGEGDFRSKDGSVVIRLKEPKPYKVEFSLQVGKTILASSGQNMEGFPCSVYQVDMDGNGLNDFIVFYNYRGPGLGMHHDKVEIYLGKNAGGFEKISYDIFDAGIEDFIGPDRQGRCRVIITGFYEGDRHNYVSYNIYEFRNYRLVNADAKVAGFPKFVQYTYEKNDKDAKRLTEQERRMHTKVKNSSIHYENIL